jgi:uridine kinase
LADLSERLVLSTQDLEMQLGVNKLPLFIHEAEENFLEMTGKIVDHIAEHPRVRAVFISGPTSSGKTTFTERMAAGLRARGRNACRLSLDNYYDVVRPIFDEDGRPDYESIYTIDTVMAGENIRDLLRNRPVVIPHFNFRTRKREMGPPESAFSLGLEGIVLVEGLHGLAEDIAGVLPREEWVGVFLMPHGAIVADKTIFRSDDFRMLRRVVRDKRHRGAHALATIDYWPMISGSEKLYFDEYLAKADFYVNTILAYESLVIAPVAATDILEALQQYREGTIAPSVFMERTVPKKAFADLNRAIDRAEELIRDLGRIPEVDSKIVPDHSILQEFIGEL